MRAIKFRAWDRLNKRMIYIDRFSQIPDNWEDVWKMLQFTGLHDKNGVEIYEGDIIEIGEMTYQVVFVCNEYHSGFFKYSGSQKTDIGSETIIKAAVIGNIYENPEMVTP